MTGKFDESLARSEHKYLREEEEKERVQAGGKTNALLEAGSIFGDEPESEAPELKKRKPPLRHRIKAMRQAQEQDGTFGAVQDYRHIKQQEKDQEEYQQQLRDYQQNKGGNPPPSPPSGNPQSPSNPQTGPNQEITITPQHQMEWNKLAPELKNAYGNNIQTWAKIKQFEQQYNPQQ